VTAPTHIVRRIGVVTGGRRSWTDQEVALLTKLVHERIAYQDIDRMLDRRAGSCSAKAHDLGYRRYGHAAAPVVHQHNIPTWTDEDLFLLRAHLDSGLSFPEAIAKMGRDPNSPNLVGTKQGGVTPVWRPSEIETVRKLLAEGMTLEAIGARVGRTKSAVNGIVNRRGLHPTTAEGAPIKGPDLQARNAGTSTPVLRLVQPVEGSYGQTPLHRESKPIGKTRRCVFPKDDHLRLARLGKSPFCDAKVSEDYYPYCAEHGPQCYVGKLPIQRPSTVPFGKPYHHSTKRAKWYSRNFA
jgi:hypothetical protein